VELTDEQSSVSSAEKISNGSAAPIKESDSSKTPVELPNFSVFVNMP
jgi:hypothetical protein